MLIQSFSFFTKRRFSTKMKKPLRFADTYMNIILLIWNWFVQNDFFASFVRFWDCLSTAWWGLHLIEKNVPTKRTTILTTYVHEVIVGLFRKIRFNDYPLHKIFKNRNFAFQNVVFPKWQIEIQPNSIFVCFIACKSTSFLLSEC